MNRIAYLTVSITLGALFLLSADCAKNNSGRGDPIGPITNPSTNVTTETIGSMTVEKYNADRDTAQSVSSADIVSLADGNNAFAIDMYKKLANTSENTFFSPYSISLALAMTWGGARGQTESDMAATLHFPFSQTTLHAAFNSLDLALNKHAQTSGFDLHIVNQLWGEKTYTFLPDYLKLVSTNYGASLNLLDFIGNSDPSRIVINNWVADQTNQKIADLIPAGAITPDTRLVLTNAIYFKAQWADTFHSGNTFNGIFNRSENDTVTTRFMHGAGSYNYDSTADYQAIEMPYSGYETSMMIILPAAGKLALVESGISGGFLTSLFSSLQKSQVAIGLPKFKFTTGSIKLGEILKSLGMASAFGNADFSGIDGTKNLFIAEVVHKAFVAVDENGTEAAAATAVMMYGSAAPSLQREFYANRPFIFLIRDIKTNTILFMGKLNDPTKE